MFIALFPPIVEDTHMKKQYSEQNKQKREIILHTLFKYNVCIACAGVSPQHTDSLVQCGYEVRFTNVKAYVLMEAISDLVSR